MKKYLYSVLVMALFAIGFAASDDSGSSNVVSEEVPTSMDDEQETKELEESVPAVEDYEENKDYQPSTNQNDTDWLQGHWVYEQGNYKGHFIIQGDKIIQFSSMNPERQESTFRIEDGAIRSRLIDGMDLVVPIDFANHTIDYGDGNWMHKVE